MHHFCHDTPYQFFDKKDKEYKFATQEQTQKGYYATYNVVKEAIVADAQKRYKFGTNIAKSIRDAISFNSKKVKPTREIATLTPLQDRNMEKDEKEVHLAQL